MKHYIIFAVFLFFIIGCKKENEIHVQQNIVIGDYSIKNLSLTVNQSKFGWVYKDWTYLFYIDCNNDSIDDFAFSVKSEYVQGGTILVSEIFKIVSLTQNAEISTDSIMNPIVYKLSDTLTLDGNWDNGELILYSKTIIGGPFEYSYAITGIWYNIYESYIGVRLDGKHLGWIKIDVQPTIHIYEWAITE
jgi:hypothetical protein